MRIVAALVLISLALAGCANDGLRDIRGSAMGPDEFMVQPVKPLAEPANYTDLPPPTPGQANLTDRNAIAEGIVAFGGRPEAAAGGIPASDGALVQQASRFGVAPTIRQDLAETDAEFRKRRGRFTQFKIVSTDRYNQVYRGQSLDAAAEAERWRNAGARTPSAPPAD
ncbi:DUF3035 domain-containing protein [Sulfitobacter sp. AS59]|uniref:DUF3035 domain-containing protein n=1 Tax=Sulfitobacter sp. AS59 TaxID=3135784 RepID=UPI003170C360